MTHGLRARARVRTCSFYTLDARFDQALARKLAGFTPA